MCKTKNSTTATEPTPRTTGRTHTPRHSSAPETSSSDTLPYASTSRTGTGTGTDSSYRDYSSKASSSSQTSLVSLRASLPENPHIYSLYEIRNATNNFLSKRISSSSSAYRCSLRAKDVVVIQRKLRRRIDALEQIAQRLSLICKSHHVSVTKLLGASLSGDHIYLVYEYIPGASLSDCLRNPRNPNYTVLSTWISRMQVAADVAQALEYVHHYTGLDLQLVHNHIKSTSVIVTESLNAKICHFGASELTGEFAGDPIGEASTTNSSDHPSSSSSDMKLKRFDSRILKVEGTRGYMPPEFIAAGILSQKSDVFAFGIVILELLSGEEPLKYWYDRGKGDYKRISLIETARNAVEKGGLRRWIDRRLRDSFPEDAAEKMTRLALDCVHDEPDKRPDMRRAAGKISKLFLESKAWTERMRVPTEFSVSMAPR